MPRLSSCTNTPASTRRETCYVDITVSIGVGEYRRDAMPPDPRELTRRVDEALYRAKRNGRNRVERVAAG